MKKFLKEISQQYTKSEEDRQKLDRFVRLYGNEDFRFFRECILVVRGFIANDFLSDRFDNLTPEQKDIQHRVYRDVWHFLEFILDPYRFAKMTNVFESYNKRQLEKIKPTQQGKKK